MNQTNIIKPSYLGRDKQNNLVFDSTIPRSNKYPTKLTYSKKYGEIESSVWYGDKPVRCILLTFIVVAVGLVAALAVWLFIGQTNFAWIPAEYETGFVTYLEEDESYFLECVESFYPAYGFPLNIIVDSRENWDSMGCPDSKEIIGAWISEDPGAAEYLGNYLTVFIFNDEDNPMQSQLYLDVGRKLSPYITSKTVDKVKTMFEELKIEKEGTNRLAGDFIIKMGGVIRNDNKLTQWYLLLIVIIEIAILSAVWLAFLLRRLYYRLTKKGSLPEIHDKTGREIMTEAEWIKYERKYRKIVIFRHILISVAVSLVLITVSGIIYEPAGVIEPSIMTLLGVLIPGMLLFINFKRNYQRKFAEAEKARKICTPIDTEAIENFQNLLIVRKVKQQAGRSKKYKIPK